MTSSRRLQAPDQAPRLVGNVQSCPFREPVVSWQSQDCSRIICLTVRSVLSPSCKLFSDRVSTLKR